MPHTTSLHGRLFFAGKCLLTLVDFALHARKGTHFLSIILPLARYNYEVLFVYTYRFNILAPLV